ncbi:MAG: hypothetical protein K1X95_12465, partial [Acidimicrobiia bacterium]|nr:hypothetical protein [Acidimicrobiia bacterium]
PRLLAYYHGSVPVAVEGDTVTVAFAAEFHRTNATKAQDEFATACEAVFGARLHLAGADAGAAGPARGPGGRPGSEAGGDADDEFDDEPLPAGAAAPEAPGGGLSSVLDLVTSELGGEVVERREPQ